MKQLVIPKLVANMTLDPIRALRKARQVARPLAVIAHHVPMKQLVIPKLVANMTLDSIMPI